MANDSLYLTKHSVLSLSENDKKDSLIRKQLLIQIQERFPFSTGPNRIMASILIDLGDCFANTASIEFAKVLYTIAKLYFGAGEEMVDSKIKDMIRLRQKFSDIKPEKRRDNGDNIRLSGISYKKMLDNNNPYNYEIDWEGILLNSDTLLAYANLERIEEASEVPQKPIVDSTETNSVIENSNVETDNPNYLNYYILVAVLVLLAGYFTYKKRSVNN